MSAATAGDTPGGAAGRSAGTPRAGEAGEAGGAAEARTAKEAAREGAGSDRSPEGGRTGGRARPGVAVLRLHRTALLVWGGYVLAAVAVLVWTVTVTADAALREQARCVGEPVCGIAATLAYGDRIGMVATAVCYGFLVVAAFAGGALFGRELENGTAHLVWTQSVSPARWLAAELAVAALPLLLGSAVLVLSFRWAWSAHRELLGTDWTFADVFVARGPATAAYCLCALAVGALAAVVLRRALPALGVSVASVLALNLVLDGFRPSLWPHVTRTARTPFEVSGSAWQIENGAVVGGRRTAELGPHLCDGTAAEVRRCMAEGDITGYYAAYHPPSHFWPLHLAETGIVLAVAALATGAAFLLLRHRTA
ncbi:hypothetical protein [Streptomyces fructofermentans]|uniref:ABC transporter permease n=1 Tax=Streptomyces fructofermentans TaxID=152141 RepID=A0A918K3V4_9ACTN|nr:hypothetical protein [Streptomyces fructofermentans]GGX47938.1 hypothetical protein GCM10010515_13800 [Streptomyces fructofermentans]